MQRIVPFLAQCAFSFVFCVLALRLRLLQGKCTCFYMIFFIMPKMAQYLSSKKKAGRGTNLYAKSGII